MVTHVPDEYIHTYFIRGVEVLVLSASLICVWHASLGLFACLYFGPSPLILFLSLSWVVSSYEVWIGLEAYILAAFACM
jgi:hypothetical protein